MKALRYVYTSDSFRNSSIDFLSKVFLFQLDGEKIQPRRQPCNLVSTLKTNLRREEMLLKKKRGHHQTIERVLGPMSEEDF